MKVWVKYFIIIGLLILFAFLIIGFVIYNHTNEVFVSLNTDIIEMDYMMIKEILIQDADSLTVDRFSSLLKNPRIKGIEIRDDKKVFVIEAGEKINYGDLDPGVNFDQVAGNVVFKGTEKLGDRNFEILLMEQEKFKSMFYKGYFEKLLVLVVLLLFDLIFIVYILIRKILKPLQGLVVATEYAAAGDFTYRISAHDTKNIGVVAKLFNQMQDKIMESAHELRILNEYNLGIVSSLVHMIITLDKNLKIKFFNLGRQRINRDYFEEVVGEDFIKIFSFLPDNIRTSVYNVSQGIEKFKEYRYIRLVIAGEELFFNIYISQIHGKLKEHLGTLIILDNVTSRIKLEKKLTQSEKLVALGEFAAAIAHEIRNPLGIMKVSAGTIKDSIKKRSTNYKLLEFIISEVDRLDRVVEQLLNFSRPKSLNRKLVNINKVIEKVVRSSNFLFSDKDIRIKVELRSNLPEVLADSEQIEEVVMNLIRNAIESFEEAEGGQIDINTDCNIKANRVMIHISDNGPGIPGDIVDEVFEPFFTTHEKGTGLGLSISRKIMESHSGELKLLASKDGARFEISLPIE